MDFDPLDYVTHDERDALPAAVQERLEAESRRFRSGVDVESEFPLDAGDMSQYPAVFTDDPTRASTAGCHK